jgi:hypothetical protein
MRTFEISEQLIQSIGNYLASRPYGEVYKIVQAVTSLKEIKQPEKIEEVK